MKKVFMISILTLSIVASGVVSYAQGEVCGGNHVYNRYLGDAGYTVLASGTHTHNGHTCQWAEVKLRHRYACDCGAEIIVLDDVSEEIHRRVI